MLRPFLTAAFSCNKHRQRPADRCRGVPRHLSAPPRRTASPLCASGCVSGRRVGLVRQASSPTPASAARAEGVARRIRCWRGRRSEAAGDLPPELPVWRPRAGRRGVVVAGALPRRRRLAAAATPVSEDVTCRSRRGVGAQDPEQGERRRQRPGRQRRGRAGPVGSVSCGGCSGGSGASCRRSRTSAACAQARVCVRRRRSSSCS